MKVDTKEINRFKGAAIEAPSAINARFYDISIMTDHWKHDMYQLLSRGITFSFLLEF